MEKLSLAWLASNTGVPLAIKALRDILPTTAPQSVASAEQIALMKVRAARPT